MIPSSFVFSKVAEEGDRPDLGVPCGSVFQRGNSGDAILNSDSDLLGNANDVTGIAPLGILPAQTASFSSARHLLGNSEHGHSPPPKTTSAAGDSLAGEYDTPSRERQSMLRAVTDCVFLNPRRHTKFHESFVFIRVTSWKKKRSLGLLAKYPAGMWGSANRQKACGVFFIGRQMLRRLELTVTQALAALLEAIFTEAGKWG